MEELHEKLNGVFVVLVGTHARFLPPGASYEQVGRGLWDIDANWVRRYLPPRAPLAGWSPCIGISTTGAPVRANDVKHRQVP